MVHLVVTQGMKLLPTMAGAALLLGYDRYCPCSL